MGEKIIHVRASKKAKAHKRIIHVSHDLDRIGDKEKVSKGVISTDYKESVKNMNNYISSLNQTDEGKKIMKSVNGYTLFNYSVINDYMKDPSIKESSENIDNIKNSISNIKKFINDAPKFSGEVYRGLQYPTNDSKSKAKWDDFIKSVEGSKEIKFGSFLSTSQSKMVAVNFATKQHFGTNMKSCLVTIKTKSGVAIESISQVQSEHEILIDSNKTYKIIKFEKQDERNHFLSLEEI